MIDYKINTVYFTVYFSIPKIVLEAKVLEEMQKFQRCQVQSRLKDDSISPTVYFCCSGRAAKLVRQIFYIVYLYMSFFFRGWTPRKSSVNPFLSVERWSISCVKCSPPVFLIDSRRYTLGKWSILYFLLALRRVENLTSVG